MHSNFITYLVAFSSNFPKVIAGALIVPKLLIREPSVRRCLRSQNVISPKMYFQGLWCANSLIKLKIIAVIINIWKATSYLSFEIKQKSCIRLLRTSGFHPFILCNEFLFERLKIGIKVNYEVKYKVKTKKIYVRSILRVFKMNIEEVSRYEVIMVSRGNIWFPRKYSI